MNPRRLAGLLQIAVVLLAGCAGGQRKTITQVSTIDALAAGVFDGQMTCKDLLAYGDLGLGTFDALDGELIVLDGEVYQVKVDGHVEPPAPGVTTPFAVVVPFKADLARRVERPIDLTGLEKVLEEAVPSANALVAVRVRGHFSAITTRSVPVQKKPYPTLAEAAKGQVVSRYTNIGGTLVGFRLPAFVKGINMTGLHLHFLSDDRKSGGHVLAIALDHAVVDVDVCNRLLMILPRDPNTLSRIDFTRDRSGELKKVEK